MSDQPQFDPYHRWLGIPPDDDRNYYRLLGLPLFEGDLSVIDAGADRQMSFVKNQASGPYARQSQQILNELSVARVCLLNPQAKAKYDGELRSQLDEPLEEVVLEDRPASFDPYHKWLGISPREQPPNHYRLLNIPSDEIDPAVIKSGAQRQTFHLQQYLTGEYADTARQMLAEIEQAKDYLLDVLPSSASPRSDSGSVDSALTQLFQTTAAEPKTPASTGKVTAERSVVAPRFKTTTNRKSDLPKWLLPVGTGVGVVLFVIIVGAIILGQKENDGHSQLSGGDNQTNGIREKTPITKANNLPIQTGSSSKLEVTTNVEFATLRLLWTPDQRNDAVLRVDGRETSFDVRSQVVELELLPGKHRIEITRPYYTAFTKIVDVVAGRPNLITPELPPDLSGKIVKLTDSPPIDHRTGWSALGINRRTSSHPKAPVVNGEECPEYFWAHAPSWILYEIPKCSTWFTAVGLGNASQSVKFQVYIDDRMAFESPQAGEAPVAVLIPAGASRIKLVIDDCGNAFADHAFWCYPRFHVSVKDSDEESPPNDGNKDTESEKNPPEMTTVAKVSAADLEKALVAIMSELAPPGTDPSSLDILVKEMDRRIAALAVLPPSLETAAKIKAAYLHRWQLPILAGDFVTPIMSIDALNQARIGGAESGARLFTDEEIDGFLEKIKSNALRLSEKTLISAVEALKRLAELGKPPSEDELTGLLKVIQELSRDDKISYRDSFAALDGLVDLGASTNAVLSAKSIALGSALDDPEERKQDDISQVALDIAKLWLQVADGYLAENKVGYAEQASTTAFRSVRPFMGNTDRASFDKLHQEHRLALKKAQEGWVDVLKLIDVDQHVVRGGWKKTGTSIISAGAEHGDHLAIPVHLDGSYELKIEFERVFGDDTVAFYLPVAHSMVLFALSGWHGEASGLDAVDGIGGKTLESSVRPGTLINGQRYRLHLRVVVDQGVAQILAQLNDRPYFRWSGRSESLSLWRGFVLPRSGILGLFTANSSAAFFSLEVKRLDGLLLPLDKQITREERSNPPAELPDTVRSEIKTRGTSSYWFSPSQLDFQHAQKAARRLGGRLLLVSSAEENEFVKQHLQGPTWLALVRRYGTTVYLNDRLQPHTYFNFSQNDPTRNLFEYMTLFIESDGNWYHKLPDGKKYLCVEWGPENQTTTPAPQENGRDRKPSPNPSLNPNNAVDPLDEPLDRVIDGLNLEE